MEALAVTNNSKIEIVAVLAVSRPDFHLAAKWLKWVSFLSRGATPYPLVVLHTKALTDSQRQELVDSSRLFAGPIEFSTPPELYEHGYSASANFQFRSAIELVERNYPGCAMLWCEADTVAMKASWVADITGEYKQCDRPFLGDFVDHWSPFGNIPHLTGVSVYTPHWREHAPSFALLPGPNPEQGWDSQCSFQTVPKMARSKTIQQIWRPPHIDETWAAANIPATTALFHQDKRGELIDVLCDRAGIKRIPLDPAIAESTYPKADARPVGVEPRVSILIVTYAKDIEFLRFCLASIKKFATGFSEVVVVVPRHEVWEFTWLPKFVRVGFIDEPPGRGMMAHEIAKCRADEWCPSADFVLHMDADCMAFRPVTPAAYVTNWQALCVFEPFAKIKNPNRHIWKEVTKKALGFEPIVDPMVRHPIVNPIAAYRATRMAVERHTGQKFDDYVLGCDSTFPQGFAEFCAIAAVGHRMFSGAYRMVEYDHAACAKRHGLDPGAYQYVYRRDTEHVVEFWSHGQIAGYKSDCEAVLDGRLPEYWVK